MPPHSCATQQAGLSGSDGGRESGVRRHDETCGFFVCAFGLGLGVNGSARTAFSTCVGQRFVIRATQLNRRAARHPDMSRSRDMPRAMEHPVHALETHRTCSAVSALVGPAPTTPMYASCGKWVLEDNGSDEPAFIDHGPDSRVPVPAVGLRQQPSRRGGPRLWRHDSL